MGVDWVTKYQKYVSVLLTGLRFFMMKIKQCYRWCLVLLCLLFGVNSGQAAISDGSALAGGSSQAGELFLNVWDESATSSYALDLGTTLSTFYANKASTKVWNLDSTFTTWAGATDALTFNVAANNSYVGKNSSADGLLLSGLTGSPNTYNVNMTTIATLQNNISARVQGLNVAAGDSTNYAANLSAVTNDTTNAAYFDDSSWGTTLGITGYSGSATVRNGGTDESLDLVYIHSPGGTVKANTPAIVEFLAGNLALNPSAATLTWTPAAVPIPSAVWLFLTGLLATLRLQKRQAISKRA